MQKPLLALIMTLILLVSTACSTAGQTGTSAPATSAPAATTEPAATEQPTAQSTAQEPAQGPSYMISETPIKVTAVKVEGANYNTRPTMWIFAKIAQMTNVTIDVKRIDSTTWTDTRTLMFASNDLPEFINGGEITNADWTSYSSSGQLLAVDDLLQYMPDYMKFFNGLSPADRLMYYDENNKLKGFERQDFGVGFMAIPGPRTLINKKWLKAVGLQMPKNFDEFLAVMQAFKTKDPNGNGKPDEIPLGGYASGYAVDAFIAQPLGIPVGWTKKADWFEADGNIQYVYTSDRYRTYLEQLNQLYSEGLLDSEYYTQNDAQYLAKGANMQIGAATAAAPFALTGSQDESVYMQYTAMIPMSSQYGPGKQFYTGLSGPGIYVTSAAQKNNHLEIVAKLVNFFWTEEYATYYYGPEAGSGVLGDWDGQGGVVWNADHSSWDLEVPQKYNGAYEYISNAVTGDWVQSTFHSDFLHKWNMGKDDANLIIVYKDIWDYVVPAFPPTSMTFTTEEQDQNAVLATELKTYISQMEAKFVMGEEKLDDASWAAFQEKLKSMDAESLIKNYKAAYARYLEKLSKIK